MAELHGPPPPRRGFFAIVCVACGAPARYFYRADNGDRGRRREWDVGPYCIGCIDAHAQPPPPEQIASPSGERDRE